MNIPWVPMGTTLSSFAILVNRLNCDSSQCHTMMTLFGTKSVRPESALGIGAALCASQIGSGTFSDVDSILHNHTLWPLYAYPLPRSIRQTWRDTVMKIGASGRWTGFLAGHHNTPIAKKNLHLCLKCVDDDLSLTGVAHWRTFHQIPGVDHCIIHRDELIGACQNCGRRLGCSWKTRLPLPLCSQCGKPLIVQKSDISPGYSSLLNVLATAFSGDWSILMPERRSGLYKNYMDGETVALRRAAGLVESVLSNWRLDSGQALGDQLKVQFSAPIVARALENRSYEAPPLLHLLLMSHIALCQKNGEVWAGLLLCDSNAPISSRREPEDLMRPVQMPFRLPPDKDAEIKHALSSKGYPVSMLLDLYAGICWRQVRTDHGLLDEPRGRVHDIVPWFDAYTRAIAFERMMSRWGDRRQLRRDAQPCGPVENLKHWHRDVLMQAIDGDHSLFFLDQWQRAMPRHIEWMYQNDCEWLLAILPVRLRSRYRLRGRLANRSAICTALSDRNHDEAEESATRALNWARDNDRLWLDTVIIYVPAPRGNRQKLLPIVHHMSRSIEYYRSLPKHSFR
ncbi:TniQ family protein [Caballeronia sp. LZ029]|uniref:TniQ family protein n=1 Tax=Caballeronia sp. LZ029 TaxID=3038564 RepID=UPI00285C9567|nr:TniQ family protein [Caballeronia sp. LZ029]MDR5746981.1 TniQ family protein [Caballeronia sp. LZ029]